MQSSICEFYGGRRDQLHAIGSLMRCTHAFMDDARNGDAFASAENTMRALFIGGTVDNSELDLDDTQPPAHYPPDSGSGRSRYRLHHLGRHDGDIAYAVYAAPDLADEEVRRVARERDYERRFDATVVPV